MKIYYLQKIKKDLKEYMYIYIMSLINEQYLERVFEDLLNHKNKLLIELKNDKDMKHEKDINQELTILDIILKSSIKYRNIIIKQKLKINL